MATAAPSSQYLATQATTLSNQKPVPASQARTAQIPLQSFNLPTFPAEAFSAGLTSLILTSDIKLDEYQELLGKPFSVPDLPGSINALTLEMFSLGYPPGFLTELGKKLRGLKSLTVYSQLFAGTTGESNSDALVFIRNQTDLQEIHLLDVFMPLGVLTKLSDGFAGELKFLEISYTFRHSDPHFLNTVPMKEFAGVLAKNKGLVAASFVMGSPDVTGDEDDKEGTEEGVRVVGGEVATNFVEEIVKNGGGKELVMLDMSVFDIGKVDVVEILGRCGKLRIGSFSVGLEEGWEELFEAIGENVSGLESLEIVGVPGEKMVERLKERGDAGLNEEVLKKTGGESLKSVKVSILRTKGEHWVKESGAWKKLA
ncbi:hypothetical protein BGZ60DRAFT_402076 [Tricladium varicosporioides]|nr:hypothetical protein BGZ60DRAFT_402076 [Hymenoscyphus varicosporioides]